MLRTPGYFRCLPLSFAALSVLAASGCDSESSKTQPVTGRVVLKGGDVAGLAEGSIVFKSKSDPAIVAMGEIKADGTFVLASLVDGKDYSGAPEGAYQVCILPPSSADGQLLAGTPVLQPRFLNCEQSGLEYIVSTGENDFTVEVEARR